MQQCWSTLPTDRPAFSQISQKLKVLAEQIHQPRPLPLFWTSQRRARMITQLGDMCTKKSEHVTEEITDALEVGAGLVTGGDWSEALSIDVLKILTNRKPNELDSAEMRASVVSLIRVLSNLQRHLTDNPNEEYLQMKLSFHTIIDNAFPDLADHVFRVLITFKKLEWIPEA